MTKEELAKWLHENYEEIAKDKKWNTQENCKVEFDTLPEQNKQTMLEIADRLLNFNLLSQPDVSGRSEQLVNFLLHLNDKQLINNHDFDYEKEAKKYLKKIN